MTKEVPKRFRYNVDSLQGELLKIVQLFFIRAYISKVS